MELTLLGTGCPAVHAERYGPAQIVRHGDTTLLIDCGSGVTQRMAQAGITGRGIDAVLLTHMHSDHIVDLFQLVISSWHQGRDRPMRVFGPSGTYRYVDSMVSLWQHEMEQRIEHEKRPSAVALQTEVTEVKPGEIVEFGAMRVRAIEVDHKPVRHAYGYVIETDEAKLVISGDTRPCDAVVEAAKDADLLLHEVFVHHEMKVVEGVRSQETIDQVASYHTLSSDVGKVAAKAGVKWLALTHFVPPDCDTDALYKEVKADFDGPLTVGADLMTLDLAKREVRHRGEVTAAGD
jgi:ribonuclease Z